MKRTRTNSDFIVLAMDPSLTAWGYTICFKDKVLEAGCIKTAPENKKRRIRKGDDDSRRVTDIAQELKNIIIAYDISYMVCELPHGSQTASAMKMVGVVLGLVSTLSLTMDIPLEWYSEADSKKAVLGKRSATKEEMIRAIKTLYADQDIFTNTKYKDEAIADSMAIYHVAKQQSPTIKFMIK